MPDVKERLNRLTIEDKREIVDLLCRMSPEDLTCDGELSKSEVDDRMRWLRRKWEEIEKRVGFRFHEWEVPFSEWCDEVERTRV